MFCGVRDTGSSSLHLSSSLYQNRRFIIIVGIAKELVIISKNDVWINKFDISVILTNLYLFPLQSYFHTNYIWELG